MCEMTTLWEWEQDFIRCMMYMRYNGVTVDKERSVKKALHGEAILDEIRSEIKWNPGSSKQLGEFLLKEMGYPVVKETPNGQPSFDKYAMEEYEIMLEHDGSDIASKIIRYRGWQKTVSSNYRAYLKMMNKKTHLLHPNYKIHGTRTGRLSCEKPNLQQIPKETEKEWNGDLKKAFIARLVGFNNGSYLVEIDYSQLELRLAAAYAKEEALIDIFVEDRDIFDEMSKHLRWSRFDTKTFSYATLYGGGIRRIKTIFNVDYDTAADMRREFFKPYPGLKEVMRYAGQVVKQDGYIEYWTGRRRHFDREEGAHKAFNSVIQGGAFEIVKRAMVRLYHYLSQSKYADKVKMVLQVHDAVVFEIDRSISWNEIVPKLVEIMTDIKEPFGVPFVVEAKEWGSKNLESTHK